MSLLALALLVSCGGVRMATVQGPEKIPQIDALIVEQKNQFLEECYLPIHNKVPESDCQNSLFQIMERRHGLNYRKASGL